MDNNNKSSFLVSIQSRKKMSGKKQRLKLTHIVVAFLILALVPSFLIICSFHQDQPYNITLENHMRNSVTTSVIGSSLPSFSTSKSIHKNEISIQNKTKPKLVLHVGPRKTATTTIQMGVLYMEQTHRVAGVPTPKQDAVDSFFLADNYKIVWHGWEATERIIIECFQKLDPDSAKDECNHDLWNDVLAKFDAAYDQGHNVIMSEEAFSIVPRTEEVKQLLQKLKDKWDVHILIVHRPLDSWLPSMYAEYRLKGLFKKGSSESWWLWNFRDPRQLTFPEWFEMAWPKLDDVEGDPIGTMKWYEEIFGSEAIHVMEMVIPNQPDITVRFVCDALSEISEAPRACEYFTQNQHKIMKRNSASILPLNEDLLVMKLWNKVLRGQLKYPYSEEVKKAWFKKMNKQEEKVQKCHIVERHEASLKLIDYMSSKNLTFEHDLPSVCLNDEQMTLIANRTFYTDKVMGMNPRSYDEILHSVQNSLKLCSVDAGAEKTISMFQDWFLSIELIDYCGWHKDPIEE